MEKPDVDLIEGLSPAISIEQKTTSHNPRSTVGTVTEIYDYLRLLYARTGIPKCPEHGIELGIQNISEMVDHVLQIKEGSKLVLLSPIVNDRKGEHVELIKTIKAKGFIRVRINQKIYDIDDLPTIDSKKKNTIEVVVDRFTVKPDIALRLTESFETALEMADGVAKIVNQEKDHPMLLFSDRFACPVCGYSIQELEPRSFSFNNPAGACQSCDGLGVEQFFSPHLVIKNPKLSISEGAIRGWDRRNIYYFHLIKSLSKHFGFNIDTPYESYNETVQNTLLYGSGDEKIQFYYPGRRGRKISRKHVFEGVIPNLIRRYKETESKAVKDALSKFMSVKSCLNCHGTRLNEAARHVFIKNKTIADITKMNIDEALTFFQELNIKGTRGEIASNIIKEIQERLLFLSNVGLNYLNLERSAETLSGGESQRIRLASQIGSGLVGVMYILDEPTIGLHQRDNERLIATLTKLRDLGNTVIVVEHDEAAIRSGDYIVDLGPGAGNAGGEVVAQGNLECLLKEPKSLTGQYLKKEKSIPMPSKRLAPAKNKIIKIKNAQKNNLKALNVDIPLNLFTCVTGVSGSGKSTLINGTLQPLIASTLEKKPCNHLSKTFIEEPVNIHKMIDISQGPIGRTPRSNPATYTGLFTPVRELFSSTQESRSRGYKQGRFSLMLKVEGAKHARVVVSLKLK